MALSNVRYFLVHFNLLSANLTKWSNTNNSPAFAECVFDHFVALARKWLKHEVCTAQCGKKCFWSLRLYQKLFAVTPFHQTLNVNSSNFPAKLKRSGFSTTRKKLIKCWKKRTYCKALRNCACNIDPITICRTIFCPHFVET